MCVSDKRAASNKKMTELLLLLLMFLIHGAGHCAAGTSVTSNTKVMTTALSATSVEISWTSPKLREVTDWRICILKLTKTNWQLCEVLPASTRRHLFSGLTPGTTHYVYLNYLDSDGTLTEGHFKPFNITTPESSTSDYTSLGSRVASEQRKGLVRWILIVGGAGLALIVILSALTVLCHRDKLSPQEVQMRRDSKSGSRIPPEGQEESRLHEGRVSGSKGSLPYPVANRAAYSVVSWGSEFDIIEGQADYVYDNPIPNTSGSGKQPYNNSRTSAEGMLSHVLTVEEASGLVPEKRKSFLDLLLSRFKGAHKSYQVNENQKVIYSNIAIRSNETNTPTVASSPKIDINSKEQNASLYANQNTLRSINTNAEIYANNVAL